MNELPDHIEALNRLLQTRQFGRLCRWYDAVDSTNPIALAWAKDGAPTGALIVAEFQKRGRGRFDRSWSADPGENLTFSLVLQAEAMQDNLELLPLALAISVAETIQQNVEPHKPSIKWPNDVLFAGRKVSGILVESSLPADGARHGGCVAAGIGINVNQSTFPSELTGIATSLFQVLGRRVDRFALLADLLLSIESVFDVLSAGGQEDILQRYRTLMSGVQKTVRFERMGGAGTTEGTILGVDASGALQVRTARGVETLRAGEVTFRTEIPERSPVVRLADSSPSQKSG